MAAGTIEGGLFILLVSLAFIFMVPGKIRLLSILSMVIFAWVGIALASQYDIAFTKTITAYEQVEIQRNATGSIVANTTTTVPETSDSTPIINAYHTEFAYLFFGLAILGYYVWIRTIFDMLPWDQRQE